MIVTRKKYGTNFIPKVRVKSLYSIFLKKNFQMLRASKGKFFRLGFKILQIVRIWHNFMFTNYNIFAMTN